MRLIIALCLFLSLLASSCTTSQLDSSEVFLQETISNVNLFQLVAEEEASDEEVISTIEAFRSAGSRSTPRRSRARLESFVFRCVLWICRHRRSTS